MRSVFTDHCLSILIFAILVPSEAQAAFSLTHKTDAPYGTLANGMQATHTDIQVIYANPGDIVRLHRPDRCALTGYLRWYCFDTDRAAERIERANLLLNNNAPSSYTLTNEYGWFKNKIGSRQGELTKHFYELNYTMHAGDSVYRIAADQSVYKDYSPSSWDKNKELREPTLSKRLIYELHPASEMADKMTLCTGETFLEVHEMIAPVGRQLFIGPDYRFYTDTINVESYIYASRSNYYFYNASHTPAHMNDNSRWEWSIDGEVGTAVTSLPNGSVSSGQFIATSSTTASTHTYTLRYRVDASTCYNVAKFIVTYMDAKTVGPNAKLPSPNRKMELVYENTFNYDEPGTTSVSYWNGHLNADESTYGYHFVGLKAQKDHHPDEPNWSEYGITNSQDVWVASGGKPYIYNHVDSLDNASANAKKGYMLFCDGSQQPGLLFNLKVDANLCPGSTMYFSAWIIDGSSTGATTRCAPNLDFIVIGVNNDGEETILTTFTTGEFGINAVENVSNSKVKMERCKWYQVMFPVRFTAENTYPTYRLKIMNKGKSSDGNDFAIDDIRIYTQKPPVYPIQASTYDCPGDLSDSVTAYLRVDYQAIEMNGTDRLYYQWRNEENEIVRVGYANQDSSSTSFGCISVLQTDEQILSSGDTCASLLAFDSRYYNTRTPVYKYVKEQVDFATERFVLYIAQPMEVRTNFIYTGFVAAQSNQLGNKEGCGTYADLMIAGSTRINVDGEALGDSIVSLCGHRSYTMDIVLTYIRQNTETDELEEMTSPCRADWLIGDSALVDANPAVYKYSFEAIRQALEDYHSPSHALLSDEIVSHLLRSNLLTLDTSTTMMQPSVSLSYTAFPVAGSAENKMPVCLTPRFMHIFPSTSTLNRLVVGNRNDVLPEAIAAIPRKVRISNAQKRRGEFKVETYIEGEEKDYVLDSIILIDSTNPFWEPMGLSGKAKDGSKQVAEDDTLLLFGEALKSLTEGYDYTFHIRCVDEEKGCERGYTYFTLRIVPDDVTWYSGAWNDDDSWDSFIPMAETNVILLPNTDYNITFSEDSIYDYYYTRNECYHIYVPCDASLAGQERIRIHGQAFVDIPEYTNKWTLTSIPIKGVVTGDLYVSQEESTYPFRVAPIRQEVGTEADDRLVYQIYNSEYDATNRKWKTAVVSTTDAFAPGEARMVGINADDQAANPVIRLPKPNNEYHYYDERNERWRPESEVIIRDEDYGKPLYQGETTITLKEIYRDVYLLGNPTLGYLNIDELIANNTDKLTGRYYLEPEGVEKRPKYVDEFPNDVFQEEEDVLLPPFRGMLLEGTGVASDQLTLRVLPSMVNESGRRAGVRPVPDTEITTDIVDISAAESVTGIYDLAGRLLSRSIDTLPEGLYIVQRGSLTHKILVRK